MEVLVEEGAAVGATNDKGQTARDIAVELAYDDLAGWLGRTEVRASL
jgi:hypothetical protein